MYRVLDHLEGSPTKVLVMDEKGLGGANHKYKITTRKLSWDIKFQEGPIKECGVNGIQIEDLIEIAIDRLEGFQAGDYPYTENRSVLENLQLAKMALNNRTMERRLRGVEGTNVL